MRESGFYFVRDNEMWTVAYYGARWKCWLAHGEDWSFNDSDWAEIDERRIERGSEQENSELRLQCGGMEMEIGELRKQRDDLLITLQSITIAYREAVKLFDPNTDDALTVLSHNAIAKVKSAQAGDAQ